MTSVEPNGRKIGHDPQNYKRDSPLSIRLKLIGAVHHGARNSWPPKQRPLLIRLEIEPSETHDRWA